MKLKAAIILDNLKISKWQRIALEECFEKIDIVTILNCQNTKNKKKYIKNFFYYLINFFSIRNELSKKSLLSIPFAKIINFNSLYKLDRQVIPNNVYKEIQSQNIDVIIKFGMNLLKIESGELSPPILSFHHGNPSKYRGRPAGFYEILNKELTNGIIVQQLNNNLDAGKILAYCTSKIVNYSYKKTAENFYNNSRYLLVKAIDNFIQDNEIDLEKNGKNYLLPNNFVANKFIYGLFLEKKWKVAVLENKLNFKGNEKISSNLFSEIPIKKKYNFYADPFFSQDGKSIRLEALDKKSGLGNILEVQCNDFTKQRILLSKNHYSYPFSFFYKDKEYILPEVASHSAQYIFPVNNSSGKKFYLKGLEKKRIVDATILLKDNYWFLFFGENKTAHTSLNLWYSISPFEKFKPHPQNPIVISPDRARMGGRSFISQSGNLLRLGQNNEGEYGKNLNILEIIKLSINEYEEKLIGKINIDKFNGPHNLDISKDNRKIVIDYYNNHFSFFAGIRRLKAKLATK